MFRCPRYTDRPQTRELSGRKALERAEQSEIARRLGYSAGGLNRDRGSFQVCHCVRHVNLNPDGTVGCGIEDFGTNWVSILGHKPQLIISVRRHRREVADIKNPSLPRLIDEDSAAGLHIRV